jgi:hypothetical protein
MKRLFLKSCSRQDPADSLYRIIYIILRIDEMTPNKYSWILRNEKERRSGSDRRYFSYSFHIPERRHNQNNEEGNNDRRCGLDRRNAHSTVIETGLKYSAAL